jgi:hypothetical protein
VVVAVVGNRWPGLLGNLLGFHAWLQPSETKEISIINHISLLPCSEGIPLLIDMQFTCSIQPTLFRCKDIEQDGITQDLDYNTDTGHP